MPFDYAKAISLNQAALRLVVEEIYGWLELVLDGSIKTLPLALQRAAYRLLVPAESALRRLIIIAARELNVKLRAGTSKPPPSARFISKGERPLSFQLFDTRKCFAPRRRYTKLIPRIHFFDGPNLITIEAPKTKKPLTSHRIIRRFAAFKSALENIPREAKRLAYWQAKRAKLKQPKFTDPMRPGRAPGYRKSLIFEVDHILKECHGLAFDALREPPHPSACR